MTPRSRKPPDAFCVISTAPQARRPRRAFCVAATTAEVLNRHVSRAISASGGDGREDAAGVLKGEGFESFAMSRRSNVLPPFVLGFSAIARSFEAPAKGVSDGYPPYNIERMLSEDGPARLCVIVAVAGFAADELDVALQGEQLVIRGRRKDEREREHLHRGIATRQFQRVFLLAEAMRIESASLQRGLLRVELSPQRND